MPYLQVSWERQLRSVQLTLVDACAAPHTLHPQTSHDSGGCEHVGADGGCDAPVGEQSCQYSSCKTPQSEEEAEQLEGHAGHGSAH